MKTIKFLGPGVWNPPNNYTGCIVQYVFFSTWYKYYVNGLEVKIPDKVDPEYYIDNFNKLNGFQ